MPSAYLLKGLRREKMPRGRWQEWLVGSRNDASCFAVSSQSAVIIVAAFILLITLTL